MLRAVWDGSTLLMSTQTVLFQAKLPLNSVISDQRLLSPLQCLVQTDQQA